MKDERFARLVGALMISGAVLVWIGSSLTVVNISVPANHFGTIIWAAVALLLGYDIRQALSAAGALTPPNNESNNNQNQSRRGDSPRRRTQEQEYLRGEQPHQGPPNQRVPQTDQGRDESQKNKDKE